MKAPALRVRDLASLCCAPCQEVRRVFLHLFDGLGATLGTKFDSQSPLPHCGFLHNARTQFLSYPRIELVAWELAAVLLFFAIGALDSLSFTGELSLSALRLPLVCSGRPA